MLTSSVSSVVTHAVFMFLLMFPWMLLLTGHFWNLMFIYPLGGPIILQRGKGSWRRWSCWHLAKISVSLRSLSRLWTSWLARCIRKTQVVKRYDAQTAVPHVTWNTQCATHVWRPCAYVDWVTSCQYLPSLSFAICQAASSAPPTQSNIIHISSINLLIYLCHHCHHNFLPGFRKVRTCRQFYCSNVRCLASYFI